MNREPVTDVLDLHAPIAGYGVPLVVELFKNIKPTPGKRWLIKRLLMAGATGVMFGPPGCGKSFLALDMALAVAAGRNWFERPTAAGGVVYIASEGQGGLRSRVHAWREGRGVRDARFALIPTVVDLFDSKADLAKVREALIGIDDAFGGIALLVVDTLAATFGGGDENGSDMATYVANIARLRSPYGCACIIVTHAPLIGDAKRPRGHGSLWGAADTVLHVTGDQDAPARRIHVLKQKDADPGPDILFSLKPVDIGADDDGDTVTSCIVEPSSLDPVEVVGKRRLSPKEKITLDALHRALARSGLFPPADIPNHVLNRARIGRVARVSDWRAEAYPALADSDAKPDTARRTFDRTREALQAAENLGFWGEWAWLNF